MSPHIPLRLALAAAAVAAFALPSTASAACHTQASYCADNEVVSVSVVTRGGTVEVHRGGFSLADQYVFCAPQFAAYLAHPERDYDAYAACAFSSHRVL